MKEEVKRNKEIVDLIKKGVSLRKIGRIYKNKETGEPLHHTTILRIYQRRELGKKRWQSYPQAGGN